MRRFLRAPAISRLAALLLLAAFAVVVDPGLRSGPAAPPPALAQEAPVPTAAPAGDAQTRRPENPQAQLDAWKVEIDQIAAGFQRDGLTDRELAALRARAEDLRNRAGGIIDQLTPSVQAIESRLKQLGPAPAAAKDGEAPPPPESDAVKLDRETQNKALAELQGFVKQASLIQLKADEVIRGIGERRRDRFTRALLEQTRSILDPSLWLEAAAAVPGTLHAFGLLIGDWVRLIAGRGGQTAFGVLALAVIFFAVLIRPVRRRLVHATERDPDVADPTPLRKAGAAAAIVAVNIALPLVGLAAIYLALRSFGLSPDRIDQVQVALMAAVGLGAAVSSLALGILAPGKPQWRLLDVGDGAATSLMRVFGLLAFTLGFGIFVIRLLPILAAPFALVIVVSGFFALVDIALIMLGLRTMATSLAAADELASATPAETNAPPAAPAERSHSILWRWLVPLAWIAAIAGAVAAVAGYVSLARFVAVEMLWAGLVLAALYIALILVDEILTSVFRRDTSIGTSLNRSMGFSRDTVEQVGVVLSGAGRLVLIAVAAFLILWPLGFNSDDLVSDAKAAFFGFKIGGLTVSLSSILAGIAVFVVAVAVTRGVQGWLGTRFLPSTRIDPGLKNSILTAFGYGGYIIAAMLAFSSVGLGLENIAIVAGALSVGIGFGLQSIVNNFVSGLILLAERPIKAGDLVEIGAEKGFVRKINVRSTEIETGDRASLIVPNSSLITGTVKNWMHRDMTGNATVNVGVRHDADPEKVKEILLAAARAHARVMIFPAPNAFFVGISETALTFRLICTVAVVTDGFGVESDLRYDIVKRLRQAGIDIASNLRELDVRQLGDLRDLAAEFIRGPQPQPPAEPPRGAG